MRRIAFFLRDRKFKVWVDNEKLIPGTSIWEEEIEKAIKDAFAVIVILSPEAKKSEWVRREITYADQYQKRIFPVLVGGDEDEAIPIRLITRQFIDFREDENAGLSALSAALTFYIEEKQTLEMKRPQARLEVAARSHPTSLSSQKPKSPKWILPAGLSSVICIMALFALWMGYRIFSSSIPSTGSDFTISESTAFVPTATLTHVSGNTPIPLAATVTAPDKSVEYLDGVQVSYTDPFDGTLAEGWDIDAGKIEDGVLEIIGNENWDGAGRSREFVAGEGVIVDFSFTENSTFSIYLNFGEYNTASYRRFGIFFENDFPVVDIYEGENYIWEEFLGDLVFKSNRTYTILIALLPDEEFLEVVWDASNPSDALAYRKNFDEIQTGSAWTFWIQANKGTILFDNFREIKFSNAK